MKRMRTIALPLLLIIALSGCGTTGETLGGSGTDSASIQANAQNNAADARFALRTLTHHRQTIELASLMQAKENISDEARSLATKILSIHEPEAAQLEGMLRSWGQLEGDMQSQRSHAPAGHRLPGMVDEAQIDRLAAVKGEQAGKLFLELMIDHHKATIQVAERELSKGSNAEAVALARTMVETYRQELGRMRAMLETYS